MISTRVNTGKYKIPLKLRKPLHKLQNYKPTAGELNMDNNEVNIEELNDTLEMINDNYDTFRTIFSAPDDINVNKEIKQETAGMLIKLFTPKNQINNNPIRLPEYKFNPWTKDLASFIHYSSDSVVSAGFDEEEYNKNKGEWREKKINDFKKLFD